MAGWKVKKHGGCSILFTYIFKVKFNTVLNMLYKTDELERYIWQ